MRWKRQLNGGHDCWQSQKKKKNKCYGDSQSVFLPESIIYAPFAMMTTLFLCLMTLQTLLLGVDLARSVRDVHDAIKSKRESISAKKKG